MKVKIQVEFEIEAIECDEDDELSENVAKSAASLAAWHNLVFTSNGRNVVEQVEVHVDGFGKCQVKVGEEHE